MGKYWDKLCRVTGFRDLTAEEARDDYIEERTKELRDAFNNSKANKWMFYKKVRHTLQATQTTGGSSIQGSVTQAAFPVGGASLASPVSIKPAQASVGVHAVDRQAIIELDNVPFIQAHIKLEDACADGKHGSLVFADGVAYVRTRGGLVNLGDALQHVEPNVGSTEHTRNKPNRRKEAIRDQKSRGQNEEPS